MIRDCGGFWVVEDVGLGRMSGWGECRDGENDGLGRISDWGGCRVGEDVRQRRMSDVGFGRMLG